MYFYRLTIAARYRKSHWWLDKIYYNVARISGTVNQRWHQVLSNFQQSVNRAFRLLAECPNVWKRCIRYEMKSIQTQSLSAFCRYLEFFVENLTQTHHLISPVAPDVIEQKHSASSNLRRGFSRSILANSWLSVGIAVVNTESFKKYWVRIKRPWIMIRIATKI